MITFDKPGRELFGILKELRKFLSTDKAILLPAQPRWPETLWERRALSSFLEHMGSGSAKSKHTFVCMFYNI